MKKLFTAAIVIGLIATPSVAFAQHGTDDMQKSATTSVTQQEKQAEHPASQANDVSDNDQGEDRNTPVNPPASGTTITETQARTIAQNQFPGKTISSVEQEHEESAAVFSVRFNDGSRVDVAISTGTITRSENRTGNDNSGKGSHHDRDNDNGDNDHDDSDQ